MKVAIIGKGHVGMAIGAGLERTGHEVKYCCREPGSRPKYAAEWGEIVIFAIPYHQVSNVVEDIEPLLDDKIVIDATNRIGPDGEPVPCGNTSGAAELQKRLPLAKVVKAFNTVLAHNQSTGHIGDEQLTGFVAGDDADAKKVVMDLMSAMGYEPVDSGPLRSAQYLEAMGLNLIYMAFHLGMGPATGYRLVRK